MSRNSNFNLGIPTVFLGNLTWGGNFTFNLVIQIFYFGIPTYFSMFQLCLQIFSEFRIYVLIPIIPIFSKNFDFNLKIPNFFSKLQLKNDTLCHNMSNDFAPHSCVLCTKLCMVFKLKYFTKRLIKEIINHIQII